MHVLLWRELRELRAASLMSAGGTGQHAQGAALVFIVVPGLTVILLGRDSRRPGGGPPQGSLRIR
jgi:hypothetical protein